MGGLGAGVGGSFQRFWQGHGGELRGRLPSVMVFFLGLALSIAAFFLIQNLQHTAALKAFEGPAGRYATAITKALDSNLEVVKSAGSFFSAAKDADRWAFFQFARDALPRHPAIQAVEWVPRVGEAERADYEALALQDGLFGFQFHQPGADGRPMAAAPRAEYYPIYYVEPFLDNEDSLGLDLAADPAQLAILEAARDSGRMVVARLQADAGRADAGGASAAGANAAGLNPASLQVILPVYGTNVVPEGRSERQAELLGFLRGVIRLGALVAGTRAQLSGAADLDVAILDRADPTGQTIFAQPALPSAGAGNLENRAAAGLELASDHQVGNQRWSIVVTPGHGWQAPSKSVDPWSVLVVGLLLTAFLLLHLISVRARTRVIEQAVTAGTAELRHVNRALEQEIRERKEAEMELRAAKEKVEVASRVKSEFLAMMGHELRTPLNAVIGFSEILSDETFGPLGDQRYRGYVADIASSGNDLLSIINDILDLTKIETDEFDLQAEALDIAELVTLAGEAAREKAGQAGLSLEVKAEPNTPPLNGSRQAVKRILDVLLSNALKFTPHGGRVTVTSGSDGNGAIVIEVADDGIGIAPKDQERVFLPFTQVDQTLSRSHEGTGLGLTLALRLVELHGGVLQLESQLGEGTKARVVFPATRSLPPQKTETVKITKKAGKAEKAA